MKGLLKGTIIANNNSEIGAYIYSDGSNHWPLIQPFMFHVLQKNLLYLQNGKICHLSPQR